MGVKKISEFPSVTTPARTDKYLIEQVDGSYKYITPVELETVIDHTNLQNVGTKTHTQLETDITSIQSDISSIQTELTKTSQVLEEIDVSADTTYVEFTSLDINTHKEYILTLLLKNPTATDTWINLFINGDTTETNYYSQLLRAYGTAVSAARYNNSSISYLNAGILSSIKVFVTKDVDGYMRFISLEAPQAPASIEGSLRFGAKTATVTNITSIRIQSSVANAIGAGSKIILCRLRG